VFSNKGYGWKLVGALALIAGLGVYAHRRGESINPPLWKVVVEPRRWDNTMLWLPRALVEKVDETGFVVASSEARIRVTGKAPAGVDQLVTLRGIFRARDLTIEMIESRPLPPDLGRRRLVMEVVSSSHSRDVKMSSKLRKAMIPLLAMDVKGDSGCILSEFLPAHACRPVVDML